VSEISRIITFLFDGLFLPFGSHRTAALVVVSAVSGAALAILYKATSNQERIRRTRDVFKARILEMRLYPDDIVLITRALFGAIASQGSYLRVALKPIVVVLVVALPMFFQIEARFAPKPLTPPNHFLVTATLAPGVDVRGGDVTLTGTPGVDVDSRPVRAVASREIVWRVNVVSTGKQRLTVSGYGSTYQFPLVTQQRASAIGGSRSAHAFADPLVHPGLPPIPRNSPVAAVHVGYDADRYTVLGKRMGWLATFLVASLVGAILPAWILRIQM
jgi:hypothetical protein